MNEETMMISTMWFMKVAQVASKVWETTKDPKKKAIALELIYMAYRDITKE